MQAACLVVFTVLHTMLDTLECLSFRAGPPSRQSVCTHSLLILHKGSGGCGTCSSAVMGVPTAQADLDIGSMQVTIQTAFTRTLRMVQPYAGGLAGRGSCQGSLWGVD